MSMACPGEQCRLLSCQLQTAPVRDWGVLSPSVSLKACSSLRKCKILSALLSAFIFLFISQNSVRVATIVPETFVVLSVVLVNRLDYSV